MSDVPSPRVVQREPGAPAPSKPGPTKAAELQYPPDSTADLKAMRRAFKGGQK